MSLEIAEELIELGRFQGQAETFFRRWLDEEQLIAALDSLDRYVGWLSKHIQENNGSG